jgi:hypothetical protein
VDKKRGRGVVEERRERESLCQRQERERIMKMRYFGGQLQINILSMRNYHYALALNVFKTTLILFP